MDLPDSLVQQLEIIAEQEGSTPADLIRRLIEANPPAGASAHTEASLPLIPARETGPIQPVTGADLDALFSREDFAA